VIKDQADYTKKGAQSANRCGKIIAIPQIFVLSGVLCLEIKSRCIN